MALPSWEGGSEWGSEHAGEDLPPWEHCRPLPSVTGIITRPQLCQSTTLAGEEGKSCLMLSVPLPGHRA